MQLCTHGFSFPSAYRSGMILRSFGLLVEDGKVERKAEKSVERNGAGAKRLPASTSGSVALMRSGRIQIVTSTRFAQRNGRGREGERADRKPVEGANRVLVTAHSSLIPNRSLMKAVELDAQRWPVPQMKRAKTYETCAVGSRSLCGASDSNRMI